MLCIHSEEDVLNLKYTDFQIMQQMEKRCIEKYDKVIINYLKSPRGIISKLLLIYRKDHNTGESSEYSKNIIET